MISNEHRLTPVLAYREGGREGDERGQHHCALSATPGEVREARPAGPRMATPVTAETRSAAAAKASGGGKWLAHKVRVMHGGH